MTFGCIGEKLGHSFSKDIHPQFGRYDYELCEIAPEELAAFMTRREFTGINVTIPYKQAVIPFLDDISEIARDIGAVNTVVNKGGKLYGDNTDFGGMQALLLKNGITLTDKTVLILGTGGTSLTARAVAKAGGAKTVLRVSRRKDGGAEDVISYEDAYAAHTDAEIIINTTPCGMFPNGDGMPIHLAAFPALCGVADAVYNPLSTRLVLAAKERGIPAAGGLYMLVKQAALACERFTDAPIEEAVIERVYRNLLSARQNLVLIGMPGCGKTTVGRELAKQLGRPLIDTDEVIVQRTGTAIPTLFAECGESGFRDIESAVIRDIAAQNGQIIATGGGAILRKENRTALKANGFVVFLDRPLSAIQPTDDRPLSRDRAALEQRYRERYPLYREAADVALNAGGTVETVTERVKKEFLR